MPTITGEGGGPLVMAGGVPPHGPEPPPQAGNAAVSTRPVVMLFAWLNEYCVNSEPAAPAACTPTVAEDPFGPVTSAICA